jgi:2-polyprenyl-3-methyl-5-hydroxy-6-metoxy-1,4-benzoquinol methylase
MESGTPHADQHSALGEPDVMPFTGERMVPEGAGIDTVWEHLYRYRLAARYVRGKDVLDVACGEGYGTAALAAAGARSVIGVDVDEATCAYARRRYTRYGIDIRRGNATDLPLEARSVDVVVSFETIEHVPRPAEFLDECCRVLRPGGLVIVSTPNVEVYNPDRDPARNPFHCSEMTTSEFLAVVGRFFTAVTVFSQRPTRARFLSPNALRLVPCPWLGRTGFGRVYWWLRQHCRVFNPEGERQARVDAVAAILGPDDGWLGRLTNPYLVQAGLDDQPMYLVVVASFPGLT